MERQLPSRTGGKLSWVTCTRLGTWSYFYTAELGANRWDNRLTHGTWQINTKLNCTVPEQASCQNYCIWLYVQLINVKCSGTFLEIFFFLQEVWYFIHESLWLDLLVCWVNWKQHTVVAEHNNWNFSLIIRGELILRWSEFHDISTSCLAFVNIALPTCRQRATYATWH